MFSNYYESADMFDEDNEIWEDEEREDNEIWEDDEREDNEIWEDDERENLGLDFDDEQLSDYGWKQDLRQDLLQDGYKDRERAGGATSWCWNTGLNQKKLRTQTPLQRFCLRIDAVSRNIMFTCGDKYLQEPDIEKLLRQSQEIPRAKFKNSTGFVLGYIATQGGLHNLTPEKLENVWNCYKSTANDDKKDTTIKKADIIRYARFWLTLDIK